MFYLARTNIKNDAEFRLAILTYLPRWENTRPLDIVQGTGVSLPVVLSAERKAA